MFGAIGQNRMPIAGVQSPMVAGAQPMPQQQFVPRQLPTQQPNPMVGLGGRGPLALSGGPQMGFGGMRQFGHGGLVRSPSKEAFNANVADMIRSGHPRDQALAAAYRTARQAGARFANGGGNFYAHRAFNELSYTGMHPPGLIHSAVPGRTDRHSINVPSGSYVFPADHLSHLGQGNTMAGGRLLDGMFRIGGNRMRSTLPRAPALSRFADGGRSDGSGRSVPIVVAGGEYLLHPEHVRRGDEIAHNLPPGAGSLERGHNVLDKWVVQARKKHVKALSNLPAPRKD